MFQFSTVLLITALLNDQIVDKKEIFSRNLYLVRAKALAVSYGEREVHGIFAIEHVYVGAESLRGERFEARGVPPTLGLGQFGNWTRPEITKGEVSIWWITDRHVGKKEVPAVKQAGRKPRLVAAEYDPTNGKNEVLFPPARRLAPRAADPDDEASKEQIKNAEEMYRYIETCARGMESVYRAGEHQRLSVLKDLARSEAPLLQGWCLAQLKSVLSKADYVTYLTEFASSVTLMLLMEHEVDCQLSSLSPAWCRSETRLKFFQRWMTGELTDGKGEMEENDIIYILIRTNYTDFSYTLFLRLLIDGLTTDRRSEDFKQQLLKVRNFRPKDVTVADAGFDYLMSQIRGADPDRRIAAARLLTHFVPLCKNQEKAVKNLLDNPSCKPIADHLTAVRQQTALVLDGLSGMDGPKWGPEKNAFLWVRLLKLAPEPQAVRFIGQYVRPSLAVDPARVRKLISELDHEEFRHRDAASRQLSAMGLESEAIVRTALAETGSTEVRRRLDMLLAQFKTERAITLRAIPILATMATPGARTLLERLASGSPDASITKAAKKCLGAKEEKGSDKKR
jgi:hypothetical protein